MSTSKTSVPNKRKNANSILAGLIPSKTNNDGISTPSATVENDIEKYIKVHISKIAPQNFARIEIRHGLVNQLVIEFQDIGNLSVPEIRKPDPLIDGSDIPSNIDYMVLIGHHRYEAMRILAERDPDKYSIWEFHYKPSHLFKNKADVIKYQVAENNTRAQMNLVEIGKAAQECLDTGLFSSKGDVAAFLGINNSQLSRGLRCIKHIPTTDVRELIDLGLDSENSLLLISDIIERDEDWRALLQQHAMDENDQYDKSLVTPVLLRDIARSFKEPAKKPELPNSNADTTLPPIPRQQESSSASTKNDGISQTPPPAIPPVEQTNSNNGQTNINIVDQGNSHQETPATKELGKEPSKSTTPSTTQQGENTNTTPPSFNANLAKSTTGIEDIKFNDNLDLFLRGICYALSSSQIANDLDSFIKDLNEEKLHQFMNDSLDTDLYQSLLTKFTSQN